MAKIRGAPKPARVCHRHRVLPLAQGKGLPIPRDPRGFALKVYSEDGNWDLVGSSTPVFFVRDGIKFSDFAHSQKPDPFTNQQEPDKRVGFLFPYA